MQPDPAAVAQLLRGKNRAPPLADRITGHQLNLHFFELLCSHLPTENTVVSPGLGRPFPSLERPWRTSGGLLLRLQ